MDSDELARGEPDCKSARVLVELLSKDTRLRSCLVDRMMRYGKPTCRRSANPSKLHGPYRHWGYGGGGRR